MNALLAPASFAAPGALHFLYTEASRYDSRASMSGAERFPAGARLMIVNGGVPRAFVPAFAASADASVSFDGQRVLFSAREKQSDAWQIYEVALAGGSPRRVTTGNEDCIRPFYLPDDRLVYSRRTAQGYRLEVAPLAGGAPMRISYGPGSQIATEVLRDGRILFEAPHGAGTVRDVFAVYSDGSGVETIRCDHGRDRRAGAQLSSGDIVFQSGPGLSRFTSARAVGIPLVVAKGFYAGPVAEIAANELLVAWRADANSAFALYRIRPGLPAVAPEKLAGVAKGHALQPVIVRARPVPPRHPSSLGDRNGANVLCLNAYTTRDARIPAALIRAVRVFAQDDQGAETKLGETEVDKDGSFYLQVPAERPIRFELVDKSSRIVRAEKGWFWMRRGEQRVCVGCHAGPERAPDNAVPAVLLRTTDPVKMMLHAEAQAPSAQPQPASPAKPAGQQAKPAAVPYGD